MTDDDPQRWDLDVPGDPVDREEEPGTAKPEPARLQDVATGTASRSASAGRTSCPWATIPWATVPFGTFIEAARPVSWFLRHVRDGFNLRGEVSGDVAPHARVLRELVLVRIADLYLAYLVELVSLIFRSNPDLLRSSETITFAQALEFPDRESLIAKLVADRVAFLLGRGVDRLADEMSAGQGFDVFASVPEREQVLAFVEARDRLARRKGGPVAAARPVDATVPPTVESLQNDVAALVRHVTSLDQRALSRWNLPLVAPPDVSDAFEDPLPEFV